PEAADLDPGPGPRPIDGPLRAPRAASHPLEVLLDAPREGRVGPERRGREPEQVVNLLEFRLGAAEDGVRAPAEPYPELLGVGRGVSPVVQHRREGAARDPDELHRFLPPPLRGRAPRGPATFPSRGR